MMINTKISEYVVFENETIFKALEKLIQIKNKLYSYWQILEF